MKARTLVFLLAAGAVGLGGLAAAGLRLVGSESARQPAEAARRRYAARQAGAPGSRPAAGAPGSPGRVAPPGARPSPDGGPAPARAPATANRPIPAGAASTSTPVPGGAVAGDEPVPALTDTTVPPPGGRPPSNTFGRRPLTPGVVAEADERPLPALGRDDGGREISQPPVPETVLAPGLPGSDRGNQPPPVAVIEVDARRYLFNNQSPEAVAGRALVYGNGEARSLSATRSAPPGESVELVLFADATSSASAGGAGPAGGGGVQVIAAVWQPLIFRGRRLLEVGDKLMGTASPGRVRDRLQVTFQRILFKDGRSAQVQAVGQDVDGTEGIPGVLRNTDNLLPTLSPVLLETANAFLNSYKDRVTTTTVTGGGPGGGVQATAATSYDLTAKNGGFSAAQGAMDKVANLIADELAQNRPYLLVRAGTRCRAYLTNYLDVSAAEFGP